MRGAAARASLALPAHHLALAGGAAASLDRGAAPVVYRAELAPAAPGRLLKVAKGGGQSRRGEPAWPNEIFYVFPVVTAGAPATAAALACAEPGGQPAPASAFATPREYALIEDALRKLDVAPMQVVVEAVITEIALNNALRYGSQWFIQSGNDQAILTQGKTPAAAPNFPGFAYLLNSGSVAATLTALSTVTDIQVLSAPNLMVLNNHTASLEVGDQVPISTGSALNNDSVISSIDYRDTGVLLKVTPRVNSGGLVLLDIVQEVSDVSQTSSSTIDSPTISVRKIATSIAVQDGQTVARLVFEPLTERPAKLYGEDGSHYQRQGLKLSKHFRAWP